AGELLVVTGGDARVRLDWAREVVSAARAGGVARDHGGYLAPSALVPRTAPDGPACSGGELVDGPGPREARCPR
ncbi:hypothetical protein GT354_24915, partial [Streptomyces sp. SID3343]|nr:hypothetical protein [Streptomyces sp. SID3343]